MSDQKARAEAEKALGPGVITYPYQRRYAADKVIDAYLAALRDQYPDGLLELSSGRVVRAEQVVLDVIVRPNHLHDTYRVPCGDNGEALYTLTSTEADEA